VPFNDKELPVSKGKKTSALFKQNSEVKFIQIGKTGQSLNATNSKSSVK
jgi:hypothetical protein